MPRTLAPSPEPVTRPPLTVSAFGMHLHAATTVDGRDRNQLERVCHLRARIIPPSAVPAPGQQLALGLVGAVNDSANDPAETPPRPRRLGWANLLARVFAVDVTLCRKCGGRMRIVTVVTDPADIARILHGARAPPRPRPRRTK